MKASRQQATADRIIDGADWLLERAIDTADALVTPFVKMYLAGKTGNHRLVTVKDSLIVGASIGIVSGAAVIPVARYLFPKPADLAHADSLLAAELSLETANEDGKIPVISFDPNAKLSEDDVWWIVTRAYMESLTRVEGTHPSICGNPYTCQVGLTQAGGENIGWKHPRQSTTVRLKSGTYTSDANGFAQFLSSTVDDLRARYDGPDDWDYSKGEMHPDNQERAYFWMTRETGSLKKLHTGVEFDPETNHISVDYNAWYAAVVADNGRWPSLPGGSQQGILTHQQYTNFVWDLWAEAGYYRKVVHPLAAAPVYQNRITDRHSFRKDRPGGRYHAGYDWATPVGTPVVATENATIKYIGYQADGAGHWVGFSPDGFPEVLIKFFHLNKRPPLKEGQKVRMGQVIAHTGNSGYGTGPHLHMEVWVGAERSGETADGGGWIDVSRYLGMAEWFN